MRHVAGNAWFVWLIVGWAVAWWMSKQRTTP
jgi:hypothetical protein